MLGGAGRGRDDLFDFMSCFELTKPSYRELDETGDSTHLLPLKITAGRREAGVWTVLSKLGDLVKQL